MDDDRSLIVIGTSLVECNGLKGHSDNVLSGVFILAVSHNRRYIDKLVICDEDKNRK